MSLEHSPARGHIPHRAFTISEFCQAHRISRGKFYEIKKKGIAPRITNVDGVQIITEEDAATWRRERAEASATTAPALTDSSGKRVNGIPPSSSPADQHIETTSNP
jgi:hypothetical protein